MSGFAPLSGDVSRIVGIDFDTKKASLCSLPLEGSIGDVETVEIRWRAERSSGDETIPALAEVPSAVIAGLLGLKVRLYDESYPCAVWIERGFGQSRRADFLLGCFFGAIYSTVATLKLPVNALDLREWKGIVTESAGIGLVKDGTRGNGNATKEVANEAARALLLLGEIDVADPKWTPDALDAFGVAYAARKLNLDALAAEASS